MKMNEITNCSGRSAVSIYLRFSHFIWPKHSQGVGWHLSMSDFWLLFRYQGV